MKSREEITYIEPKYSYKQIMHLLDNHKTSICIKCTVHDENKDCIECLNAWYFRSNKILD